MGPHDQQPLSWRASLARPALDDGAPYGFEEFERRLLAARRQGWQRRRRLARFAAGALAVVCVLAALLRVGSPQRSAAHATATATAARYAAAPSVAGFNAEEWLARLPEEPAIVRIGQRVAVVDLEDRIANVDDLLSDVTLRGATLNNLHALQAQRAQLVDSLARIRYAEQLVAQTSRQGEY